MKVPLIAPILKGAEAIVVNRAASGPHHDEVFDQIKARASGRNGFKTQILIFPEGTSLVPAQTSKPPSSCFRAWVRMEGGAWARAVASSSHVALHRRWRNLSVVADW